MTGIAAPYETNDVYALGRILPQYVDVARFCVPAAMNSVGIPTVNVRPSRIDGRESE